MSDPIIQVESLSKQYRLGEVSTGTIAHDINRWWARMRGKEDPTLRVTAVNNRAQASARDDEFVWALKDVNFEVQRGEVLGVIGRNGAGKSTLLKILSRITAPTTGEIRVDGRIASLLEVGTGFHPELTGRENIFLNGAILGMTQTEIRSKLDEIVEFSGCSRYLDTPVKRYSSGMVVRLGFAVAAHLEPDILIVDEVLAVGDAEFQKKCIGKMQDVAAHGRTVLFVSHNLAAVQNLCGSAIWMDNGTIAMPKDAVAKVVDAYEESGRSVFGSTDIIPKQHRVISPLQIQRIEMIGQNGECTSIFKYGEPVRIRMICSCSEKLNGVSFGMAVRSSGLLFTTLLNPGEFSVPASDVYAIECLVPGGDLLPGIFYLDVGASRSGVGLGLDYVPDAISFSVSDAGVTSDWKFDRRQHGIVSVSSEWITLG